MSKKKNIILLIVSVILAVSFLFFLTFSYLSHLRLISDNALTFYKVALFVSAISFSFVSLFVFFKNKERVIFENKKVSNKTKIWIGICWTLLTLIYTAFIGLARYYWCYGQVDAEQIYYHTFVSAAGMDWGTVITIGVPSILGAIIFGVVLSYIIRVFLCLTHHEDKKIESKRRFKLTLSSLILIFTSLVLVLCQLFCSIPILHFTYYQHFTESSFIKDNYVDPQKVNIEVPAKKQNLVYIYLESVENTFLDTNNGGAFSENLMPEYTKLCQENINFSNTNQIGGALKTYGITYTTAGIFAQGFGLPLKVGTEVSAIHPNSILPNRYNLFDILNDAGYSQHVVMGSDIDFGGLRELFESHGDMNIYDYQYMVDTGFVDKGYKVFWGVEDEILYDFSKRKLNEISKNDEPFVFVMETVDTHNPNGYVCGLCQNDHDSQYANVVACASRQLEDFMSWSKQQDWYDNTTFVIVGDHLSMKNDFFTDIDSRYDRTTVNCFVNAINTNENTRFVNRQFSSLDMFPTILSAIGFKIERNRLGLGTNLFSNQKTIFEEYGYSYVNQEFKKNSTFYKNLFTGE